MPPIFPEANSLSAAFWLLWSLPYPPAVPESIHLLPASKLGNDAHPSPVHSDSRAMALRAFLLTSSFGSSLAFLFDAYLLPGFSLLLGLNLGPNSLKQNFCKWIDFFERGKSKKCPKNTRKSRKKKQNLKILQKDQFCFNSE